MPKNEHLMADLRKRYGDRADEVYWGMAGAGTGPFGPRGKYRAEHEAIAAKAGGSPTRSKGGKPQGRGKEKPRTGGSRAVRGGGYRRRKR